MSKKKSSIIISILLFVIFILVGIFIHQHSSRKTYKTRELPSEAITELDVRGGIEGGFLGYKFRGHIYNGSDWTLFNMIIRIVLKRKDGTIRWDRKYKISSFEVPYFQVSPLSTGSFKVEISDYEVSDSFEWHIVSVKGRKYK